MAVAFPLFFILLLLIVLALVIGLIVIVAVLVRSGKAGGIVALLIGGGVFVMIFVVIAALFTARVSHQAATPTPAVTATTEPRVSTFRPAPGNGEATWLNEPQPAVIDSGLDADATGGWGGHADQHFKADVYPSIEAASASLARQLQESLVELAEEPRQLTLRFVSIEGVEPARVGGATERALQDAMPALRLLFDAPSGNDGSSLRIRYEPTPTLGDASRVTWELENGDIRLSAMVRDKPWVTPGPIPDRLPGGGAGFVARSQGLFGSLAEADRDATTQLAERYRTALSLNAMAQPHLDHAALRDQGARRAITAAIERHGLIRDRFVQRIERPYGELYRVAVLADGTPSVLHQVTEAVRLEAAHAANAASHERNRQRKQVVSVGALLLLVVLVYGVLNALTKHYYLWPLRAAALMLLIVGLLATLMNI